MRRNGTVRSGSSRLYVPRGWGEGEAWAMRGCFVPRRYFSFLLNPFAFGGGAPTPTTPTFYLDTDGSNGDGSIGTPWNSLENARTGLIALHPSLVADVVTPTLICTGATDDTTSVTNTWPTSDTTYFLTIKVPDAHRKVVWNAGHYTYKRTTSSAACLAFSANSIRLIGLQIQHTASGSVDRAVEITALGGEFIADSILIRGNNGNNQVGFYARQVGLTGKIVIRNCFVLSTLHGYLLGGPGGVELATGTEVYVYNCSHWGQGFGGGEGCNIYFVSSGSGRIARVKNLWLYAQTNGVTITNADTSDTATNSHSSGAPTSHFVSAADPGDWRLVSSSSNVDAGTDLSAVGAGQFQFNWDASLYTRPYNGTWDIGFHEYRP